MVKVFNQNLNGEIHIWSSLLDQPEDLINRFHTSLSKEEKDRISKYKFKLLRDRQTVSKGLLKSFISSYLNIGTGEINFVKVGCIHLMLQQQGKFTCYIFLMIVS